MQRKNREGISRAYENIGRVYARSGKYKEALEVCSPFILLIFTFID